MESHQIKSVAYSNVNYIYIIFIYIYTCKYLCRNTMNLRESRILTPHLDPLSPPSWSKIEAMRPRRWANDAWRCGFEGWPLAAEIWWGYWWGSQIQMKLTCLSWSFHLWLIIPGVKVLRTILKILWSKMIKTTIHATSGCGVTEKC